MSSYHIKESIFVSDFEIRLEVAAKKSPLSIAKSKYMAYT